VKNVVVLPVPTTKVEIQIWIASYPVNDVIRLDQIWR